MVGSQIHFEIAELGINGPACVLAIEPCPEIESGRGRVITGTFTTARCSVLELRLSNGEVLEPTPPHRFFSETRQDWVAAGELRVGECLRTASGQPVTLESVSLKAGEHRVYNLEVEQEHQFYVGETGVLVHNAYEVNKGEPPALTRANQGERTTGILSWEDPATGETNWVRLESGADNARMAGLEGAKSLPGATPENWHHVEYQALEVMRQEGITDATLTHNWWKGDSPCYYCADNGNPLRLQQSLSRGSTLQLGDRTINGLM